MTIRPLLRLSCLSRRLSLGLSLLRLLLLTGMLAAAPSHAQNAAPAPAAPSCPTVLNHTPARLQDETPQNLCRYAGNVILVVNTASYCGYTNQYEGLEKLYARYQAQGFVVLGFTSNDFQQEPDANSKIADFCTNTYGVKFPMFAKSSVTGAQANAFYQSLFRAGAQPPKWNFHKILLDRRGNVVGSYPSKVTPDDAKLIADIEKALARN